VLQNLRTDGIVPTLGLLPEQVAELTAYLTERPCYQGHVRVYGDRVPRPHGHPDLGPVFCHAMADVLSAPHFWELALRTAPVARMYLGAAAHMYSVNAFWARPWPGEPTHDLQTWHRDGDDVRFLAALFSGRTRTAWILIGAPRYTVRRAPPSWRIRAVCTWESAPAPAAGCCSGRAGG
jgi:hypothetical protein